MVPIAIRHPSEMSAETPQAHRLIRAMPSERSWSSTTAGIYPGKESAGGVLSGTQPKAACALLSRRCDWLLRSISTQHKPHHRKAGDKQRQASRQDNRRHHRGPAGVHQRGATYSGGVYDLTNRVGHELGLLLVYVMAAVGVIDEPGAGHLAHEIAYGVVPCVIEQYAELLRLLERHRQSAVLYVGRQVERFVRLERDKGHRLQGGGGRCLCEV